MGERPRAVLMPRSYTCSNRAMGVQRPSWWCYPERCENGHEWGPGLITLLDAVRVRPRRRPPREKTAQATW